MAQTGFTPIQVYSSSTAAALPSASNLLNNTNGSELAINITDGKLFYKDNANAVQVIAWKVTPTTAGGTGLTTYLAGDLVYYSSGTTLSRLGIGTSGTFLSSDGSIPNWKAPGALTKTDDTNVTLTLGGSASTALVNAASITVGWSGTLAASRGGTGNGTYAVGDLLYASGTTTLSRLADVATGNALISGGVGVAPSWGKIGLTTHVSGTLPTANGGTGSTSTTYCSLTTNVSGTLPVANGGTNLTSFTSGGVVYASSTSALATGSDLQYVGSNLLLGTTSALSGNKQITVVGASTARGALQMGCTTAQTSGVAGSLIAYNGTNAVCGIDWQANGAVNSGYIGTYTYNAGVFAQGPYLNTGGTSWTTASDSRLKTIDGPITNALDRISTLLGLIGTMKSDPTQTKRAFLIAQDVEKILPEIVTTDANGYLGIQYEGMIPLIVNAINELKQQVAQLAQTK